MQKDEKANHLSAQEGYDQWSQFYDRDDIPLASLETPILENWSLGIKGKKALDLGCGTGRVSFFLAEKGAHVTGVDQSEGMLEKAREKNVGGKVEFLKHDLHTRLPFEDNSFDFVISCLAAEHLESLLSFFAECKRLCKKEQHVVVTGMHPAMLLKGVQARFTQEDGSKVYPKSYPYETSDFVNAAIGAGLVLEEIQEKTFSKTDPSLSERSLKYAGWPMLLALKFRA